MDRAWSDPVSAFRAGKADYYHVCGICGNAAGLETERLEGAGEDYVSAIDHYRSDCEREFKYGDHLWRDHDGNLICGQSEILAFRCTRSRGSCRRDRNDISCELPKRSNRCVAERGNTSKRISDVTVLICDRLRRPVGKRSGAEHPEDGFYSRSTERYDFSVICEELGLVGGIALILLFIFLIWRLMVVIINARDLYGSLLVVGVMAHISVQVLINIAVVTNTIPNTGIPLPFISYGGTSLTFLLVEMGIVLSVAKQIKMRK